MEDGRGKNNWFLGFAWEPISRGSASAEKNGGKASGSAFPGRA